MTASMSGQRAPMRVRMSSPRENTQAMAICAMVTLASAMVLTASTTARFGSRFSPSLDSKRGNRPARPSPSTNGADMVHI